MADLEKAIELNIAAYNSGKFFTNLDRFPIVIHRLKCCGKSNNMVEMEKKQEKENKLEAKQKACQLCNNDKLTPSVIKRRLQERYRYSSSCSSSPVSSPLSTKRQKTAPLVNLDGLDEWTVTSATHTPDAELPSFTVEIKNPLLPTPEEWTALREFIATSPSHLESAIEAITKLTQNTEFPLPVYSAKQLKSDLSAFLQQTRNTESTTLSLSQSGQLVCQHFFRLPMLQTRQHDNVTVFEAWNQFAKRKRIWREYFKNYLGPRFNARYLLKSFGDRFYRITNFRPVLAARLYDDYFLKDQQDKRVLDPCAGFGGRLLGFWGSRSCSDYVGIDPNSALGSCYKNLLAYLEEVTKTNKAHQTVKRMRILKAAAEDMDFDPDKFGLFDICFTSPPYFNAEIYSHEQNQSCHRYPTLGKWRDEFLFKLLVSVTRVLKPTSILAINLSNVGGWEFDIEKQMVEFVASRLPDFHLEATLQWPVSQRSSTHPSQFAPCFVWKRDLTNMQHAT